MDEVILPVLIYRVQTCDKLSLEMFFLQYGNVRGLKLEGKAVVITPLLKDCLSESIIELIKFHLFLRSFSKQRFVEYAAR